MNRLKQYHPFSEIPSVILWEILGRVPIKTCLACKLVCKEWYHVVVNPDFSSFRSHCVASRFSILVYNGFRCDGEVIFNMVELEKALDVVDSGKCVVGVDDLIRNQPKIDTTSEIWWVTSHCNGVVCLKSVRNEYFVCRLLTGQCVKVQNLHELQKQSYLVFGCELGCCPVTGEFKVLMFLCGMVDKIERAKIQTLGNGEWRSVGNPPLRDLRNGCFLNGSSHWCGRTYIWSFHFGKEKFLQIPVPDDIINATYNKRTIVLSVFDSCLCLSCFSGSSRVEIDIWIMKDYGVKESWVRQFVIVNDPWSVPLVHMDKGKILVRSGYRLYLYDLQTQVSKRVEFELSGLSDLVMRIEAFDASFTRF